MVYSSTGFPYFQHSAKWKEDCLMKKAAVVIAVIAGIAALAAAIAIICTHNRRCDEYCSVEIPFRSNWCLTKLRTGDRIMSYIRNSMAEWVPLLPVQRENAAGESIRPAVWEDGSVGKWTHLRLFASGLPELSWQGFDGFARYSKRVSQKPYPQRLSPVKE